MNLHFYSRYLSSHRIRMILILSLIVFTTTSYAESYVPSSEQSVVAKWTVPKAAQQPKIFIAQLIKDASKPGLASRYYGRASALLKPLLANNPNDLELQFYSATVLQHYHQFTQAQQLLSQILVQQPQHIAAWLMKANIHMVQGDLTAAKTACLRLLGQSSLLLSSACLLEVNAEQGKVEQSYQQLKNIVKLAGVIPSDQNVWIKQILADLAYRQKLPEQALNHLSDIPLSQAPVSFLALWSDIQLSQQQYQKVLEMLGPIVENSDSFDDALLLRLALAEQQAKAADEIWNNRLEQRITIRLQRNDTAHAADIARYYLDIAPDANKALHWAKINWQQAKMTPDQYLLERAKAAQRPPESLTKT